MMMRPTCPWCKSESVVEVDARRSQGSATSVLSEEWREPRNLFACQVCGLWIKHPSPTEAELQNYYAKVDFRKWENPGLYPNESRILSILERLPEGAQVLDIGCSTGRLLSRLAGTYDCFGVEPNLESATAAIRKGVRIVSQDILSDPECCEQFDAVLLVDVFEHLLDPRLVIEDAVSCLRQDGVLVICTGDTGSRGFLREKSEFWYFENEEHVVFYNYQFASYITAELSLKLTEWISICHYDSNPMSRFLLMYKRWLYRVVRHDSKYLRVASGWLPGARKALRWKRCPPNNLSKDHAISVFQKQGQLR